MARYRPDHPSFARFMVSEQSRRPAIEVAKKIAEDARATAPRGDGPGPHMADQYRVNEDPAPVNITPGGPRVGAEVFNDDINATRVEFGNAKVEKQRPLGKAGDKYHVPKGLR